MSNLLKKLIENLTSEEVAELSALLSRAEKTETTPKKKQSFKDRQEAGGTPCRLCEHNLGDADCCALPAAKAIYAAFEGAGIPRGPGRVAGMKRAKELQAAKGWGGPTYSREMREEALRVAREYTETPVRKSKKSK